MKTRKDGGVYVWLAGAPLVIAGIVLLLVATAFTAATSHVGAIKDGSSMTYVLVHPLHRIEAVCKDVTCTVDMDDATHTIQHTNFSADVSCFDSGNSNRDSHAMEVLDALSYPTVSFESTKIEPSGSSLLVHGNLTFHGQTKPIDVHATTAASGNHLTVQGGANVSLTAFGIERPSLLMIPTEDTLHISFTMVFPTSAQ